MLWLFGGFMESKSYSGLRNEFAVEASANAIQLTPLLSQEHDFLLLGRVTQCMRGCGSKVCYDDG